MTLVAYGFGRSGATTAPSSNVLVEFSEVTLAPDGYVVQLQQADTTITLTDETLTVTAEPAPVVTVPTPDLGATLDG